MFFRAFGAGPVDRKTWRYSRRAGAIGVPAKRQYARLLSGGGSELPANQSLLSRSVEAEPAP
jgi:hypothetical protein